MPSLYIMVLDLQLAYKRRFVLGQPNLEHQIVSLQTLLKSSSGSSFGVLKLKPDLQRFHCLPL